MPPKQADGSGQKSSDALYIFESLFHVATPVLINVNEIAAQTGAKPNTISKRFSIFRQRYPGLNIQTTSAPSTAAASSNTTIPATPGPTRTPRTTGPQTTTPKAKPKTGTRQTKKSNKTGATDAVADTGEDEESRVEDETTAEVADDEATPAKPAPKKRKRVVSVSINTVKDRPTAKKAKARTDPDETVSEDELALINTADEVDPTATKKGASKGKEGNTKDGDDGDEGTSKIVSSRADSLISAATTPAHFKVSQAHPNKRYNDGTRSRMTGLPLPVSHQLPPHANADTLSLQIPTQATTKNDARPLSEQPEVVVSGSTLLRTSTGRHPRHRVVGIDIGFDAVVNGLSKDNNKSSRNHTESTGGEDDQRPTM